VESELVTHKSEARMLLASYNPVDVRFASQANQFEAITRQLCQLAAFVVLDLGPALPPKTDRALPFCDELIIVLEPTPNAISRSQTLIDILNGKGFGEGRLTTILYNRQRTELQFTLAQVQQDFKHSIAQVFTPAPDLAFQSAKNNTPLIIQHPDNITSQQFFSLIIS
jgi:MinD-like ATPase involved in chromosome partitioning or flagellar assembly